MITNTTAIRDTHLRVRNTRPANNQSQSFGQFQSSPNKSSTDLLQSLLQLIMDLLKQLGAPKQDSNQSLQKEKDSSDKNSSNREPAPSVTEQQNKEETAKVPVDLHPIDPVTIKPDDADKAVIPENLTSPQEAVINPDGTITVGHGVIPENNEPLPDSRKQINLNKEQKERLHNVITFPDFPRDDGGVSAISDEVSTIVEITDNNSDSKLSVGDTIKIHHVNGEAPEGFGERTELHTLTQDELDRYLKAGNNNTESRVLELTDAKEALVKDVYNFEVITEIKDNDSSGAISAGDTISGKGSADARVGFQYTVNADQASHMNGEFGSKFDLSDEQTKVLNKEFSLDGKRLSLGGVLDQDGNGKLSEGDVLYTRAHLVNTAPPADYHKLTAENVFRVESTITHGNELPVTVEQQQNALKEIFGVIAGEDDKVRIHDKDGIIKTGEGSGIIKAGDTAVLYSEQRINDKSTVIATLSQDDVFKIQYGKDTSLTNEQHQRALETFGIIVNDDDKVRIADKDGDGKISAGDEALLYSTARIEGRVTVLSTLSEAEAQKINRSDEVPSATDSGIPDNTIKLNSDQKENLINAINFPDYPNDEMLFSSSDEVSHVNSVFDNDSNGSLSAGDTIAIIRSNGEAPEGKEKSVVLHTLTQDELDRFNKASDNNLGENLEVNGQPIQPNFYDWFKKTYGDFNKDGEVNKNDLAAWLKEGKKEQDDPVSLPPVSTTDLDSVKTPFSPLTAGSHFTLDAPKGSKYIQQQGFDSVVGQIKTPEYTVRFDKGLYGGINNQFDGRENYQTKSVDIDGKNATLATYFDSRKGAKNPYKIAITIPLSESTTNSLTLHANLDSAEKYAEVEKLFRSIKVS